MREYHIFEGNGGDYHLAVVEDGKCICWLAADLATVVRTRDDLASDNCDTWDVDGREAEPQACWDQMQHFLETATECRELDADDIAALLNG